MVVTPSKSRAAPTNDEPGHHRGAVVIVQATSYSPNRRPFLTLPSLFLRDTG